MAMSYTTLVADKSVPGSIKSWQNYSKIDSEGVLEEAQTMVYERLRVREMKMSDNFPVKAGASSIDVPDGFLDPILVRDITNDLDLDLRDETLLEKMRSWSNGVLSSGDPSFFGIYDEAFNFDCKVTTAFTLRALFYGQPDSLSSSNPTNFMTKRYPHLLRMACLATGARFAHDDDIYQREQKLLYVEIDELAARDEMKRSSYTPVMEP